jgi:hypothetical protein
VAVRVCVILIDCDVRDSDGELAAVLHRVPCVDDEIHHHLFELARHRHDAGHGLLDTQLERDLAADHATEHPFHVSQTIAHADDTSVLGPAARIIEELDTAAEGTAGLEPIRVSGGTMDGVIYNDVRFIGRGPGAYEGAVVTFRIGSSSGVWRLGSGQVRIVGGAFDAFFPEVLPPIYHLKLAHIDADGSGACEGGEPAFGDQALISNDLTLTVAPTDARFRTAGSSWCDAVNNWPIP